MSKLASHPYEQDTFAGYAEREPLLVSELLEDLHVAEAPLDEQQGAVGRWLDEGHKPNRMLAVGLRARGFRTA